METWRAGVGAALDAWPVLLFVGVLIALRVGLRRFPRGPRLPVLFFVLYAFVRPLASALVESGWYPAAGKWSDVAAALLLTWAAIRMALYLVVEWPARLRGRDPPAKIVRDVILAAAFGITGFILLRTRGEVNLAGLLTTSALITAVIGFASQTVLSSFFSGVALQVEHPFGVGDWIEIDGFVGQVAGITWRSTRLLDRRHRMIYLPNAWVASSRFRVMTRPQPAYTAVFTVGLEYDAPPNLVRTVILDVVRRHPRFMPTPPPEVRLMQFGDFSIEYEVRFTTADCANETRTLAEIRNDLWYALRRAGIRIPFPIRDVQHAHIERRRIGRRKQARAEQLEAVLSDVPVLAPLSHEERALLVGEGHERVFGAGEALLRRGTEGRAMFIVLSGQCSVFVLEEDKGKPVATIGPGDCCGEMSLLTGAPCSATVRADEDVEAFEIDKPLFRKILMARPEVAECLAGLLSSRQHELEAFGAQVRDDAPMQSSLLARIRSFFHL